MLSLNDFFIKLLFRLPFYKKKRSVNFWIRLNNSYFLFSCFLLHLEIQNNYGASDKTGSSGIYTSTFFQKYLDSRSAKTDLD